MTPQTTLDILVAARAVIATPDRWCTGHFSKDATGYGFGGAQDSSATQFCARGALFKAAQEDQFDMTSELGRACISTLAAQVPSDFTQWFIDVPKEYRAPQIVSQYNNAHSHTAILEVFDRAIAAERTKLTVGVLMADALNVTTQKQLVDA